MNKSIVGEWFCRSLLGLSLTFLAMGNAQGAPGDKIWEFQADSAVNCAPAIGEDGTVFIGTASGQVYALDGVTGEQKWLSQADGGIAAPVLGANGSVYVGTSAGTLFAFDSASGQKRWSQALGTALTVPALGPDGSLYCGSSAGYLFSINGASGATNWVYSLGYPASSSPTVGNDGAVYIGAAGVLHAVAQATGSNRWTFAVSNSSIDTVFGNVLAFELAHGSVSTPIILSDGTICSAVHATTPYYPSATTWNGLVGLNPATGNLIWFKTYSYSYPFSISYYAQWNASPVVNSAGFVLAGDSVHGPTRNVYGEFFSFDVSRTNINWGIKLPEGSYFSGGVPPPYGVSPSSSIGSDGTVYFCSAPTSIGTSGSVLNAINSATGEKLWTYYLGGWPNSTPAIGANGTIYVGSDSGKFYAIQGNSNQGLANSAWPKVYGNARNTGSAADTGGNYVLHRLATPVTVSTVAGSGQAGFADAPGTNAHFNAPGGCWVAADGTVYVADTANQRIRKVASDGTVTTVAGSGTTGHQDGAALAAQFNGPVGICGDGQGNFWITETNQYVRKLDASGQVTTVAGSGVAGLVNGPGASAQFNNPHGIVTDGLGNVWVADSGNHVIRMIMANGMVSTWTGTGVAGGMDGDSTVAQLNGPSGLTRSASGILYVSEWWGNSIRRIRADGQVDTLSGSGITGCIDGSALAARFNQPDGLALDSAGSLWVADSQNHVIRRVAADGSVQTAAGLPVAAFADGAGKAARFSTPSGIGFDAQGNAYVADTGNHRLRKLSLAYDLTLANIPDQTVDVLQTLTLPVSLTDTNALGHGQFQILSGAPDGMAIDSQSGVITWTPTLLQGRTTNLIRVQCVDLNGVGDAKSFQIVVNWPATVPGGKQWEFAAGGAISGCPAVDDAGTVYFGSADKKVYAVNGLTGEKKWEFETGGAIHGTPALSISGLIYIGSDDGKMYALEAGSGQKRWEYGTGSPIYGAATIGSGRQLFFGSGTNLYAVDVLTGTGKWVAAIPGQIASSPVIDLSGALYVLANVSSVVGYASTLYALDAKTGSNQWQCALPGSFCYSQLSLGAGGMVFVGADMLYAIDPATRTVEYSIGPIFTEGMPPVGGNEYTIAYWDHFWDVYGWLGWRQWHLSPVIGSNGTLYSGMHNHTLWAAGGYNWNYKWAEGGYLASAPALGADGAIYAGTTPGILHALNGANGTLLWLYPLGGVPTAVALGPQGTVYVGTDKGQFLAITGNSNTGIASGAWPKYQADAGNTGSLLLANRPPELAVPAPQIVNELDTLRVTLSATDPDVLGSTLTYLLVSAPAGAQLNAETGVLTWTPTEAQGPSTNTITVAVVDDGVPPLGATNSFTVIVNEVKSAPALIAPGTRTVTETQTLRLQLQATDSDIPTNKVTFKLMSAPEGMTVDAVMGWLTWTPTEAQGPSTNSVSVLMTDDTGMGSISSFTVTVEEAKSAPVVLTPADQVAQVGVAWSLQLEASDTDIPANTLAYKLVTGPEGMVVDAQTGWLTWTPGASQVGSTNGVAVQVTDDTGMAAIGSFRVTVMVTNTPPNLFLPAPEYLVWAGAAISFTNTATDADVPANTLTFSLGTNAPAGAKIDANTGVFTWTAPATEATNYFTIVVTDDGTPAMSASAQLAVITRAVPEIRLQSISRDSQGQVQLSWSAAAGLRYQVQARAQVDSGEWVNLGEPVPGDGDTATFVNADVSGGQKFYRIMTVSP